MARITDDQYQQAQRALDAMARSTRRGRAGTPEEIAAYVAAHEEWEAANAMPYRTQRDLEARDVALLECAAKHGLIR